MNVLITGGYGFIGSYTAERFYKEGHKIYIIDNFYSENSKAVSIKHTFFNIDVHSQKCEEVFKSNHFDLVIHLAGQSDSVVSYENPYIDGRSNIMGLINIMELSKNYKVKKFIYVSSTLIYDRNTPIPYTETSPISPDSPYEIAKYTTEMYLKKWSELYGQNIAILRMGHIYGPRQSSLGEGAIIACNIKQALTNKKIVVYGNGKETYDFLYVEDAVDALYKTYEKDFKGVLNISSSVGSTIDELIKYIRCKINIKEVHYESLDEFHKGTSIADNSKAKTELDWSVKYSLSEGIEKTLPFYIKEKEEKSVSSEENKIKWKDIVGKILPYAENFLGFIILYFIYGNIQNKYDGILNNPIDYSLIYIVLISIMYGTNQALISIILSSFLFLNNYFYVGGDIVSFLYEIKYVLHLAFYVITGVSIGYSVDRKNNEIFTSEIKLQSISEKYDFLKEIYENTRSTKNELQSQIINSEDNFGRIFSVAKSIDSLNVEDIFNGATKIIMDITKAKEVCIYSLSKDGKYLRLMGKSKNMAHPHPSSIKIDEIADYYSVIHNKNIYVNRKLIDNYPTMAAPILDEQTVIGIIALYSLPFENLTLYHENLFKVLVELISNSLNKAYKYEEATLKEKCIDNTFILKDKYFKALIDSKKGSYVKSGIEFSLIRVINSFSSFEELYFKLAKVIRDTDSVGMNLNGEVYLLLPSSTKENCEIVIEKLSKEGISSYYAKVDDYV